VSIVNLSGTALTGTGVEDEDDDDVVPTSFSLHQNYPNPFNPSTTIAFDLPESGGVSLTVYNVLGQRVAALIHDQVLPAGTMSVEFDASSLPSGIYVYVLSSTGRQESRSMVLMK
jgi:hypothetical protein